MATASSCVARIAAANSAAFTAPAAPIAKVATGMPAGTSERLAAGEKVVVMPPRLEFTVGDQIRIRNEDSVEQSVGPYLVQAGQELLLKYGKEGTYEGYCPLTEGERYEIVVKAA